MSFRRSIALVGMTLAAASAPAVAQTQAAFAVPRVAVAPLVQAANGDGGFMGIVDSAVGVFNGWLSTVIFADVMFWDDQVQLPFVVLWLVFGAIFLTFQMGFINIRGFRHAIDVTRGKFSNPKDAGEISHFQALTTALSATVGLGNIAGVAIAVSIGGPGATFWMIIAGLLGMSTKFTEVTLGQAYREVRSDGRVLGGPMEYLSRGLAGKGLPKFGKLLALVFCLMCIGGSLGGGNSFQVNQSLNALTETVPFLLDYRWVYGLIMAVAVGLVIIGGIKSIANTASRIVPSMVLIYVLAAIFILLTNITEVPGAFAMIVGQAFAPDAAFGGFVGVLVQGFRRAAFSNEAGAGSASIAHSAAKSAYPIREGVVALLEPFIDTVVVCTMTSLVIVITGAYNNPQYADVIAQSQGAALTSRAMAEHISWFPYVLSVAVMLFAYSTMISWFYYGERCWTFLFGDGTTRIFQIIFVVSTFLGSIVTAGNVLAFGDLMILGLAIPNLLGVYFLFPQVKQQLNDYWAKYKAGEFPVYK